MYNPILPRLSIVKFQLYYIILFHWMSRRFIPFVVKLWSTDPDKWPFSPTKLHGAIPIFKNRDCAFLFARIIYKEDLSTMLMYHRYFSTLDRVTWHSTASTNAPETSPHSSVFQKSSWLRMSRESYVAWTTKRTSYSRNPKFCLAEQKCGGFGKTSLVCIKNFSSKSANQLFQNCENDVSGSFKIACQDPSKSQCSFPIKIEPAMIWRTGGDEKS